MTIYFLIKIVHLGDLKRSIDLLSIPSIVKREYKETNKHTKKIEIGSLVLWGMRMKIQLASYCYTGYQRECGGDYKIQNGWSRV